MRRVALTMLLVASGLGVALVPDRVETEVATVESSTTLPSPAASAIAYCGWTRTEAALEMGLEFAGLESTEATVSVPQQGVIVNTDVRAVAPFGSAAFERLISSGAEGSIVEFATGPASVAAIGEGVIGSTGVSCPSVIPDTWILGGGATTEGTTLELRLFNPFPEDAKVAIVALSENGIEPDQSLEAVSVPAQSSRSIRLDGFLTFRTALSLEVSHVDGRVVPVMIEQQVSGGIAAWTGVGATQSWIFPAVSTAETPGQLVLVNPSASPIGFRVRELLDTGESSELDRDILAARQVRSVPVGPGGYIVEADAPMGAFVFVRGEGFLAATSGASEPATTWLLPGAGSVEGSTLHLLNPSGSDITATVTGRAGAEKVVVPAGGVAVVPLPLTAGGVHVVASAPVVASWMAQSNGDTMLVPGVPRR